MFTLLFVSEIFPAPLLFVQPVLPVAPAGQLVPSLVQTSYAPTLITVALIVPTTSSVCPGVAVPMPTESLPSMTSRGVVAFFPMVSK